MGGRLIEVASDGKSLSCLQWEVFLMLSMGGLLLPHPSPLVLCSGGQSSLSSNIPSCSCGYFCEVQWGSDDQIFNAVFIPECCWKANICFARKPSLF
ncbi:hypothetical protein CRG98_037313 [Punica granatum]|uniref:Uncharacterized protein n=1 Tax=Punica granatum TaxID=22663 RepID=A0A2I0IE52_PUNGR|nr:hypothetical protein CRG98_037313 [Punica granatum]